MWTEKLFKAKLQRQAIVLHYKALYYTCIFKILFNYTYDSTVFNFNYFTMLTTYGTVSYEKR